MHKKKKNKICLYLKHNRFFQKSDLQQRKMKNCEVNTGADLISETSQFFQTGFTEEKKACYTECDFK